MPGEKINTRTSNSSKSFEERLEEIRVALEENLRYTKAVHEFTPKDREAREEEYKKLLKDSLDYSKACFAVLEKIHRWIIWQRVFSIVKLVLIIIPIVFGIIYLPPLLQGVIQQYSDLLAQ